jgi:hypothetical protein
LAWGGSLNKDGSDYIRKLKEVEKILHFLETFKKSLKYEEKKKVAEVIDIITEHFKTLFQHE